MRNLDEFYSFNNPIPSLAVQLQDEIDTSLVEIEAANREVNPGFKNLEQWVNIYLGPATAEFHDVQGINHPAIRDENRNAIIPARRMEIDGRLYFLSIKGCGAYEDMFFGGPLTNDKIAKACRDPTLLDRVRQLRKTTGFIMAENWMGESPFGAQGEPNAHDGLEFSMLAKNASINGAFICPVIGIVPLAGQIEDIARKFYWFRQYPKPFYQEMRLIPSRMRLFFESPHTMADPFSIFGQFHIDTPRQAERFEMNFIRSGFALLSLFSRSAKEENGDVAGLAYYDIWFDKDAIVAPDGTIHFADIEGLDWKHLSASPHQTLQNEFHRIQRKEWDKLVYEFLYALVQLDTYRCMLENITKDWVKQRDGLSFLIQMSIDKDPFLYTQMIEGTLFAYIESPVIDNIDPIQIPILQNVTT